MNSTESKKTLFILEGEKFEPHILKQIRPILEEATGSSIKYYKACCDIYTFFNKIEKGQYDDGVLTYLKSIKAVDENGDLLFPSEKKRPDTVFSSIYLVFDFEPQATLFNEAKIQELCSFFDDETTNGKLLLNFPMIESIQDVVSLNPKDPDNWILAKLDGLNGDSYKKDMKARTVFRSRQNHPHIKLYLNNIITSFYVNAYRYLVLLQKETSYLKEELAILETTSKELELMKDKKSICVLNTFILVLLNYKEYQDMALEKLR